MGCCVATKEDGSVIIAPSAHYKSMVETLPSMAGKTVAITGCTSGTGRNLAKVCLQQGAKVYLINRASERADAAQQELQDGALKPGQVVTVPCDLMSFKSVRSAGELLNKQLANDGLDVLVNNAGIMGFADRATEDGCDVQMQTNHTAHFLLTGLCMPLLQKAASMRGEARIVNHSSAARKMDGMTNKFDTKYVDKNGGNLGGSSNTMFKGANFQRYQQTKLANVIFTYALRDKLEAKGMGSIKALVAHPGVAPTRLTAGTASEGAMEDFKSMPTCLTNVIVSNMMQSEEDGSQGIMKCTFDPNVKSGEFYGPKGKTENQESHDTSEYKGPAELKADEKLADAEARAALWDISEKVTGFKFTI